MEKITFVIDGNKQIFGNSYDDYQKIIKQLNDCDSIRVLDYPDITTNQDAKSFIHGIWNYGSLFTKLCEIHNVEYVEQIIEDKYVGEYNDIKDLILDIIKVGEVYYEYLDTSKCISKIKQKYVIINEKDRIYLLKH